MLGLQRKAAVFLHRDAALAGGRAVLQEVGCVELDAGLGGVDLHADAGLIAGSPGAEALAGPAAPVDDEAVVVAAARHGGLRKAGVDVPADDLARPEIHGRIVHRQDVAGGAGLVVALQIAGRIEAQLLVQHVPASIEVEIGMVGQVQDGVGIGRDAVVHPQGVVLGEDVPHRNFQVAGEAVLARRALGLQQQGIAEGLDVVDLLGKVPCR